MIDRICLLLEALSVVICLHHLYGEKFRLDIKTVGFLAVDMIIMEFINHYELSKSYTMIIYPIIVLYCGLKFGFKIRALIVNNILYIMIVSIVQFVMISLGYLIFGIQSYSNYGLLFVNIIVFCVIWLITCKFKIKILSTYLQDKERIIKIALIICIITTAYCLVQYKGGDTFELYQYIFLFAFIIVIGLLIAQISKYKIKAKEIETELKMHKLYADSFSNLIENIRMRQHEFDNHINTIYSQHLLCDSYEELVEVQKEYCHVLEQDNRYNKLLKSDNYVIRGFLYGKFIEIDKLGINVLYRINIEKLEMKMPVYKLVEILGDLINNAVEAMMQEKEEKSLYVSIIEIGKEIEIEIRNTSKYISRGEIHDFFDKGYSKKGDNRGLGLYNVKKLCDEYSFDILYDNKVINDVNWLSFVITNRKTLKNT